MTLLISGNKIIRSDINITNSHDIDMFNDPVNGISKISQLYVNEQVGTMPDKFRAVIMNYSFPSISFNNVCNNVDFNMIYSNCINQWRLYISTSGVDYGANSCCCSHEIMLLYYVYNIHNQNILLVGSDCVKKFSQGTQLQKDFDQVAKLFRKCNHCNKETLFTDITGGCCNKCEQYRSSDKKICRVCLNLRKLNGFSRCKSCYKKENIDYLDFEVVDKSLNEIISQIKPCVHCSKQFYSTESWKTMCRSCYRISQQNNDKTCTECMRSFHAAENWKTVCTNCYKQGLKICERCNKSFHSTDSWKKICITCYRSQK